MSLELSVRQPAGSTGIPHSKAPQRRPNCSNPDSRKHFMRARTAPGLAVYLWKSRTASEAATPRMRASVEAARSSPPPVISTDDPARQRSRASRVRLTASLIDCGSARLGRGANPHWCPGWSCSGRWSASARAVPRRSCTSSAGCHALRTSRWSVVRLRRPRDRISCGKKRRREPRGDARENSPRRAPQSRRLRRHHRPCPARRLPSAAAARRQ